jgi:hypothetical protein
MIFAATGRSAFSADTVPAVMHRILYDEPDVSGLPPSLQPVVRECLDKDPGRRPTARDVLLRLVDPSAQQARDTRIDRASRTGSVPVTAEPTISGPGPAPPSRPGAASAWSRRGPVLAAGGAAVIALIVLGVLLLTRGPTATPAAGTGGTSAAGHTGGAASITSSSASVTAQATGATIPSAFAGNWTGTATMAAIGTPGFGLANSITFTLVAGARTAHENNQSCVNTLTLTNETATVLTFSEPQTAQCVAGTVTLTRHGANLAYRWTDNIEQNTATLHRT